MESQASGRKRVAEMYQLSWHSTTAVLMNDARKAKCWREREREQGGGLRVGRGDVDGKLLCAGRKRVAEIYQQGGRDLPGQLSWHSRTNI